MPGRPPPEDRYCGPPDERSLWEKIKEPESGLGTGWRSWACCAMPMVFHSMPEPFRADDRAESICRPRRDGR